MCKLWSQTTQQTKSMFTKCWETTWRWRRYIIQNILSTVATICSMYVSVFKLRTPLGTMSNSKLGPYSVKYCTQLSCQCKQPTTTYFFLLLSWSHRQKGNQHHVAAGRSHETQDNSPPVTKGRIEMLDMSNAKMTCHVTCTTIGAVSTGQKGLYGRRGDIVLQGLKKFCCTPEGCTGKA